MPVMGSYSGEASPTPRSVIYRKGSDAAIGLQNSIPTSCSSGALDFTKAYDLMSPKALSFSCRRRAVEGCCEGRLWFCRRVYAVSKLTYGWVASLVCCIVPGQRTQRAGNKFLKAVMHGHPEDIDAHKMRDRIGVFNRLHQWGYFIYRTCSKRSFSVFAASVLVGVLHA